MSPTIHSIITFTRLVCFFYLFLGFNYEAKSQYCTATASGTCYSYLGQVSFGTINQVTVCANYTAFYRNWSASASNSIARGDIQNITLRNPSSWSTNYRIYIDWNGDLDFVDADELVLVSGAAAANGGTFTMGITCPPTATIGTTRMRIKADWYNNFGGGPCASSTETETQDYGVVVTAPLPSSISGIINVYQSVTAICASEITVPIPATFAVGDKVLLIQMRGSTIDITNTAAHGDITAMNNCGKYEFLTIASVSGSLVRTSTNPKFAYTIGGQVQLIKVASYTLPTITVTGVGVSCPVWNGSSGGVIAIETSGTLTLNGNIDASATGFRRGAPDNAAWGCNNANSLGYSYPATSTFSAPKGEGIGSQLITASNGEGRGKAANAGGGGNNVNAGGGGGSNGAIAGLGGWQWASCGANESRGIPGLSLASYYTNPNNIIFMGGAGGGGHAGANVTGGGRGANGGGIIIITAATINGTGSIVSRGDAAPNVSGQWAGGGGGAGGTILLNYNSVAGSIPVSTNGGNGGPAYWSNQVGPGGGGSGGVLWVSGASIPAAITYTTTGGIAGTLNNNGATFWGATNGEAGITTTNLSLPSMSLLPSTLCVPLPIGLLSFTAKANNEIVDLDWITLSETNNSHFTVERAADGLNFTAISKINGAGNSTQILNYSAVDHAPLNGISYYRLKQTDYNGQTSYSKMVSVEFNKMNDFNIYPNPSNDFISIGANASMIGSTYLITDLLGRQVLIGKLNNETTVVDISSFSAGIYFFQVGQKSKQTFKVVKK